MQNYPISGAGFANYDAATAGVQVKAGEGLFFGLNVNTGDAAATVTLYDGTSTGGAKIGTYDASAVASLQTAGPGIGFAVGLFAVIDGDPDITIVLF